MDFISTFTVSKEEKSQVHITGEIPYEELEKYRAASIAALGKNIEIDGFRKGHIPEERLIERIGESTLLGDMAERTLAKVYPMVIKQHNIEAIGNPQIQVTKLAPKNPLGFTATVAVMPTIELSDYKNIAKEANKDKTSAEVTDEDIQEQTKEILRQKIAYERIQAKAKASAEKKSEDGSIDLPTPETHTHADGTIHEGPAHGDQTEEKAVTDDELPELTDELVKEFGQPGQFESVADFKAKLKEHLAIEKAKEVTAAHRAKITDMIVETTTFELPQIMIDAELNQMFAQMEEDLKRANLSMDDYLGHLKKTKEDLKNEWAPAAEKRARLQLILNEIAKKEDIQPDKEKVEEEVSKLLEQYKDADANRVRIYVASVLQNEETMKML
ncbi:MAG: trigger factor, partial [Candidatus Paceibacterota bacterium]